MAIEELVPVWALGWQTEPRIEDEDVVRQLVENRRVMADAVATRFFAGRVDGEIGSYCELYRRARNRPDRGRAHARAFRNRGLARATVMRALAASRAAGHDLTFLIADRDDWPKELYAQARLRRDRPHLGVRAAEDRLKASKHPPPEGGMDPKAALSFEECGEVRPGRSCRALALGILAALIPFVLQRVYGHRHVMFSSSVHFAGVGLTALTAALASLALTIQSARRGDGRTVLVGTAFSVMASLFAIHGLATPGVLIGYNGVIAFTGGATLPVGAACSHCRRSRLCAGRRACGR